MLVQVLGWSSQGLLAVLLINALRGGFLAKYPLFFAYVASWFCTGLVRFYYFSFHPDAYLSLYWYTQFALVAGGFSILWQIYGHTLNPYPGTAKLARVLVGTVFIAVLSRAFLMIFSGNAEELTRSVVRAERDFHSVGGILIVVLVLLVQYYAIPLGLNMKGLLLGYGFFLTTRLTILTLESSVGKSFYAWWYYLEQVGVLGTLVFWWHAMRSYKPNPVPEQAILLERDYEMAVRWTANALLRARGYLVRALLQ